MSAVTLDELFSRFAARYPALFTELALAPLRAQFGDWTDSALGALGFEIRLDADRTVDLSGLVINPRIAHAELERIVEPGWQPLLTLLVAWDAKWRDQLYNMWFEFDAQQTRPMPAVFLQRCMPKPKPKGSLAETFAALELVAGPVAPDFIACGAGADAHVCYVGALLSRADGLYRLALPATRENMTEVLALLGWRGDRAALEAVLAEVAPLQRNAYGLDVDWSHGGLHDKIGIDVTAPDLAKILPWLNARELVTPAIATDLARVREMSHLKLVFDGEHIVHVKAYLRYNTAHAASHRS